MSSSSVPRGGASKVLLVALANLVIGQAVLATWRGGAIDVDDECGSTRGATCALSAIQRRGQQAKPAASSSVASDIASNASLSSQAERGDGCSWRPYTGARSGSSLCFCQLTENSGCAGTGCACPQGCDDGVAWRQGETVTFKNKAQGEGCPDNTVLLTSPRSYFKTPADLVQAGRCANGMIARLLKDSWDVYQRHVSTGSVWQCFHGSQIASVGYVHLQTFCSSGNFHGMPTRDHFVASCVLMRGRGEASSLAPKLAAMVAQDGR